MLALLDENMRRAARAVTMVNCDDDRSEDSVMALIDVDDRHIKFVGLATAHLAAAINSYNDQHLSRMYFHLARAAADIDLVLEVIERIEDKPRNESPNGPLPVREKRAH